MARCSWPFRFLLMTGFACSLWFIQTARNDIAEQMAVEQARHYMEALTAFRTLYTKTVVAKAKAHGMKIGMTTQSGRMRFRCPRH